MTFRLLPAVAALALAVVGSAAAAGAGGTITGIVTWGGKTVPKNEQANVDKDKMHCPEKVYKNELIVDAKTKGVANVIVWLIDAKNPLKPIPFKGKLPEKVVIDQPRCEFVPRILFIAPGQKLVVKNSAKIAHNIRIDGGPDGPSINPLMPPGSTVEVEEKIPFIVKKNDKDALRSFPIPFSCSIHGWMKGFLFAVPSGYAEVTSLDAKGRKPGEFKFENVPPGDYKVMAWHEKKGFLLWDLVPTRAPGKSYTVAAGKTKKVPIVLRLDDE